MNRAQLQRGFTLIEMIVVMVIIAIVAAVAMLAFSHFGESQQLAQQADLTANVLKYAREDAIVGQNVSGVEFFSNGYQMVRWKKNKFVNWNPISAAKQQQGKVAYQFLAAHTSLGDKDIIAFLPNGSIYGDIKRAPYRIILTLQSNGNNKTIKVMQNGMIK